MSEPEKKETAIAVAPSARSQYAGLIATSGAGLEPSDLGGLYQLAEIISKAKLVPDHFKEDPGSIVLVALQSRQLGIPIVSGLQSSYVVGGKVGWSAVMLEALAKRSPRCEQFYLESVDDTKAVYVVKTTDMPEALRVEYTIEMARRAGLIERNKATWGGSAPDMLVARCRTRAARRYFAEELVGIFSIEELRDAEAMAGKVSENAPAVVVPAGRKAEAMVESFKKQRAEKNVTPPAPTITSLDPVPSGDEQPEEIEPETDGAIDAADEAKVEPPAEAKAAKPIGEDAAQKYREAAVKTLGKFGARGLEAECKTRFKKSLAEINDDEADQLDEWLAEMAKP